MAGNSKNVLLPYHFIVNRNLVSDVDTTPINIQYLDNVSVQLIFTGSPVGTFKIYGSLTYSTNPLTGVQSNAGTFTDTGIQAAVSAAGTVLFNLAGLAYPWIKVYYSSTSGTGSVDGYISAKAV